MKDGRREVASDFDVRAPNYSRNEWHRVYAEGLVAVSAIGTGDRVLDAGVGTGFAAIAAATRVGPSGRVVGVDVSPGMLQQARMAVEAAQVRNVTLVQADACALHDFPPSSFDAVICAAALLYMPVHQALAEWHRLVRPGGTVAFSTMRAGFPRAGQLFRDCAAAFGLRLKDPSAALGDESAAAAALDQAGFADVVVIADRVQMSGTDFAHAWESNIRSAAHREVRTLPSPRVDALRSQFEQALENRARTDRSFAVAEVLYAYGCKPTGPAH